MKCKEHLELAEEMRGFEDVLKPQLSNDSPVVVRVDGRAFRTFTKGMREPYDEILKKAMKQTMIDLCSIVPGCVYAYSFSDEISLVLVSDENKGFWYNNEQQKLVSSIASLTTAFFNKNFSNQVAAFEQSLISTDDSETVEYTKYLNGLKKKLYTATFDCRAFNMPADKIKDYLKFRQLDCIRNSVASMYRSVFGKSASANENKSLQDMNILLNKEGKSWSDMPSQMKYGFVCEKENRILTRKVEGEDVEFTRKKWTVPDETPDLIKEPPKKLLEYLE